MTYRTAVAADVPALTALVHSAYRGDTSRGGWTTEADLLDGQRVDEAQVAAILAGPDSVLLVLDDTDGSVLGCCQLERRRDALAYFGMFAIRPGRQGGGVGRAFLAEAEAQAQRRWGATALEMTVIAQRAELVAWYERRGYVRTGETRPFPYGDVRYGQPRRDDLHFVVLRKQLAPGRDVDADADTPRAQAK